MNIANPIGNHTVPFKFLAARCGFRSGLRYSCTPDRKSTRLNSSHLVISYAVFCLKKKKVLVLRCLAGYLAGYDLFRVYCWIDSITISLQLFSFASLVDTRVITNYNTIIAAFLTTL